ncbi:protein JTB isoform X1 [Dicentrarchus labrax]|uniref:Protein JTB n=1 Tax=Dicentrarchus labrax TaxID=13489 RepID=A0A8P4KAH1_DICLA|nr:protein JTB isoform X1 [Dicentrarchus labrax]XP_051246960.1 protein JTB isoform X1 [Dicentrarchus labrax]XP_051246961.1 protein JTB isoform X1 [Dicentrarchus labrax]
MESDCRIPVACCRPRVLVLHALFWGLVSLRVFGAALLSDSERTSAAVKAVAAPCWLLEDFVVTTECGQCNAFQTRSWSACEPTGYVERVNCTRSNRDEYKSCRSAVMEEHLFWKFEAAMLALTALFAVLVVVRQRWLDRLASEKVRRQIESI